MDCDQVEQERRLCKFLTKSKQMYEAIEYIINKPERVNHFNNQGSSKFGIGTNTSINLGKQRIIAESIGSS